MSGFQIPGLGQAKPNEVLPPLPQDAPAPAASAEDKEMRDANPPADATETNASRTHETKTSDVTDLDLENPPSLTGALEAALGGLDDAESLTAEHQQQQPALEPDQSEHPEWEVDSSPYESSSESSTSDSSDEESGDEGYTLLGVEETARLLMEMEGGSDDEGQGSGKASGSGYTRTKNELAEAAVPRPDVTITPEMKIEELGAVEHMVANTMLIKAFTSGEYQVLDGGSVLCNADRAVVGAVAETIGKVLQPMYTVMFGSEDEMRALGMEVGAKVYYPVDLASFVFTEPLKGIKGSDASNLHDEEIGAEEMEFSDDEKEAEYRRSLKQKKKDKWKGNREPHPLRQEASGGLNYDDGADDRGDDDGPYKPLARPAGYGSGPVSVERLESRPRPGGFQRGKGRDRGRGGGRGRPSRGGKAGEGSAGPREGYSLPPQGRADEQRPAPSAFPSLPNFPGFTWPQPGSSFPLPPPPPPPSAWAGQGQPANGGGAFVNPAFIAALMSQMQSQGANGWQGHQQQQQPHPPPPPGGY